jgi:membrane fusion protein, multidrug efflux system
VEQRMVKVGERVGNLWLIDSGAKPGEKVIVEGIQRVRPGVKVNAKSEKSEAGAALSDNAATDSNLKTGK